MRHVEHARQVGVDDLMPLLRRHLVKRCIAGDAGVVDQDVDRAKIGLDLRDACGACLIIANGPFAKVKLYFSGTNLALFSEMDDLDPEDPRAGVYEYPMMRTIV